MRKLRRNFESLADVRLFLRILFLYAQVRLALRRTTPIELLKKTGSQAPRGRVSQIKAARFTDYINRLTGDRGPGKCLVRSLVLFRLLRASGVPVEISLGLNKFKNPASGLDGHCWLSLDGRPILEAADPTCRFVVFYSHEPG